MFLWRNKKNIMWLPLLSGAMVFIVDVSKNKGEQSWGGALCVQSSIHFEL